MQVTGETFIRDWYHETYPTDPAWQDMHYAHTFMDLYECLNSGEDVYDCLFMGTGMDSLVRERCFKQLAKMMQCDYDYVYEQWLHGAEIRKDRLCKAVAECTAIKGTDGCGHAKCAKYQDGETWTNCIKEGYCTLADGPYAEKSSKDAPMVGDIWYSSWGYEQTNIDWYQVTKVTKTMVTLTSIKGKNTPTAFMQGETVPCPNEFTGKQLRRKFHKYSDRFSCSLNSYSSAFEWDGRPKHYSDYA